MGCTEPNPRINLTTVIHDPPKYGYKNRPGLSRFSLISKREMAKEQSVRILRDHESVIVEPTLVDSTSVDFTNPLTTSEEILKRRLKPSENNLIRQIGFRNDFELSRFGKVSDFRKSDFRVPRAGIIFYTFVDDQIYCCFGRDRKTQDLTDFGGGRKKKESSIQCALREGGEESRFVFGKILPDEIDNYRCLYSTRMLIIFIPVEAPEQLDSSSLQPEWLDSKNRADIRKITVDNFANKTFLERDQERDSCFNELSSLVWVNEAELIDLFSSRPSRRIFSMVRKFICSSQLFNPNRIQIFKNSLKELFAPNTNLTELVKNANDPTKPIVSFVDNPNINQQADNRQVDNSSINQQADYPAWSPFDTPKLVTLN